MPLTKVYFAFENRLLQEFFLFCMYSVGKE
jgi:hypothetical protein